MTCELFTKLYQAIDDAFEIYTATAKVLSPEELGLDTRCADKIFVQNNCIIVTANEDKDLQYYGGFEYVEKEHRLAIGHYVCYSGDSSRVKRHLENLEIEH